MNTITARIQLAMTRATQLHWAQKRKGDGLPYIIHPYGVGFIVSHYTDHEDTICAAFLHDVLEDIPAEKYPHDRMIREFGKRVYQIVKEVSEDKDASVTKELEKSSWKKRKLGYIANLKLASPEALIVCCGDKIHNLQSLIKLVKTNPEGLKQFNATPAESVWFYGECLRVLEERCHNKIVVEYRYVFQSLISL